MTITDKILKLVESLLPRGRAFRMKGEMKKLHTALAISEAQAHEDSLSILDSILPDNDNFSLDDASAWETRLGLITNTAVSLTDRKLAIRRKMNYPGDIPARQGLEYLQGELDAAGFDVYVYENMWWDGMEWVTQDPSVVTGGLGYEVFQLNDFQLGESQLGEYFGSIIANSIYQEDDRSFDTGENLRATFFIGGNRPVYGAVGLRADVDANREEEFRQLVLKIKPTQTVALLLIDYY